MYVAAQRSDMASDNIVVFDGICNLCSNSVRFIIKRDKPGRFRFAPMQSAAGAQLLKEHAMDPEDIQTFLLIQGGKSYMRSDAVLRIARQLSGFWKIAWILIVIPRPLRDWCYDVLAQNRYRWFGRRETCMVPTDDIKNRFLD